MKKAYKYGIELETCIDRDQLDNVREAVNAAHLPYELKGDGSIQPSNGDDTGIEFVCSKPLNYTTLDRSIKALSRILVKYDVKVNSSTGFHVHISNKRFLNPKTLKNIVFTWASIEDVMFSTQPRSRYSNSYCKRVLRKYIQDSDYDLPKAKELLISHLRGIDRYYALNLSSMSLHGTIECRLHSGTIDSKKVMAWVDLLIGFYNYCISDYNHEEVVALFNEGITDEKIDKVLTMFKINQSTIDHFKARTNRFAFDQLNRQQEAAKNALLIKPRLDKAQKVYNKVQREFEDVRLEMTRVTREFGSSY